MFNACTKLYSFVQTVRRIRFLRYRALAHIVVNYLPWYNNPLPSPLITRSFLQRRECFN